MNMQELETTVKALTASGLGEFISGVILFEETLKASEPHNMNHGLAQR